MKKLQIALLIIFLFLSVFVSFSISQEIKKLTTGMPNTVTLSNGDIVYDLNGEWDAITDDRYYGTYKSVWKITQEGNKFVGYKLPTSDWLAKGRGGIKGELEGDRFKSLYVDNPAAEWTPSKGKINDGGNKIVIEVPIEEYNYTSFLTLTRK